MTKLALRLFAGALALGSLSPANASQLISDRKVGQILGEVHCGKRDINNAVRYLNSMGVPAWKLQKPNAEVRQGHKSATLWC